jgi:REP element-mobilizing transposase RayT
MCGRSVTFRKVQLNFGAAPQKIMTPTFQLSRDSQALFITAVTKDRLPVFKTDALKVVTCQALDEARKSGGFLLFAYVIMPNHVHLLTDCPRTSQTYFVG